MDNDDLQSRAAKISLLVLDVDGVLTDGSIIYADDGTELKRFHVRDGSGLKFWRELGNRAAIISGRRSAAVERRANELRIDPMKLGRDDKANAFAELLNELNLQAENVCAIGDDLPDIPVLRQAGLAVAVADACAEVREIAHYTTTTPGGRGAVREAIEWLLKLRGEWSEVLQNFSPQRTQ